jgi:hypothetical protein
MQAFFGIVLQVWFSSSYALAPSSCSILVFIGNSNILGGCTAIRPHRVFVVSSQPNSRIVGTRFRLSNPAPNSFFAFTARLTYKAACPFAVCNVVITPMVGPAHCVSGPISPLTTRLNEMTDILCQTKRKACLSSIAAEAG